MSDLKNILIVGAGPMAAAYYQVLKAQGYYPYVICRSQRSVDNFFHLTGCKPQIIAIPDICSQVTDLKHAIVCVDIPGLSPVAEELLKAGIKNVLVEKPLALSLRQIDHLANLKIKYNSNVYVAFNRRFYSSIIQLEKNIKDDGGITSLRFDFTEWSHRILSANLDKQVLQRLIIANSSHVIDLAFYMIGLPELSQFQAMSVRSLPWHTSGSIFNGFGLTCKNIPFSYSSDWNSASRWSLEIFTPKSSYLLKPLETLSQVKKGSTQTTNIPSTSTLDSDFKPGLFLQCDAFLNHSLQERLSTIEQYRDLFLVLCKIGNYDHD